MSKKVILTGDRPTGPLHIGHYFGSLLNRQQLQHEFQTYIMIADVQALTDNYDDPAKVRDNVLQVAADNMALGLEQETSLFVQSQIPQIAELTVFYSNLVTVNRLKHNPTVKAEIREKRSKFGKQGENLTFGFLGYPVSQAADITVVRANLVPVGVDQLPMIEQTREIVEKFNRMYSTDAFPVPEAKLSKGQRIKGLDGQNKMSKSLNNCIYLSDSPESTIKKFKSAKTDSEPHIGYDPENRPGVSNLIQIYSLIHDITPESAVEDLKGLQYGAFKLKLAEDLNEHLKEFRERREDLIAHPEKIYEYLSLGKERVTQQANITMEKVREAMHIDYRF